MDIRIFDMTHSKTLTTPTERVNIADEQEMVKVRDIADRMLFHTRQVNALGLAANQVGMNKRFFVYDVSPKETGTIINPTLRVMRKKGHWSMAEGCLSLPGLVLNVSRPWEVEVSGYDLDLEPVHFWAREWLGRVIQHETDHLDGILFIQRYLETEKQFRDLVSVTGLTG